MGKKRKRERFTGDIRAKPIVIRPRKERKRGKETGREKIRDEGEEGEDKERETRLTKRIITGTIIRPFQTRVTFSFHGLRADLIARRGDDGRENRSSSLRRRNEPLIASHRVDVLSRGEPPARGCAF